MVEVRNSGRIYALMTMLAISIAVCSLLVIRQWARQDDWKARTTPLPTETRVLLCSNFELPKEDPLCSAKRNVYGLDFMDVIRDEFRPFEAYGISRGEAATYDEVEQKIGKFRYDCEPVVHQADGLSYFACSYDLRGDREFIMTLIYTYPENAVMRIMSTSRFDD